MNPSMIRLASSDDEPLAWPPRLLYFLPLVSRTRPFLISAGIYGSGGFFELRHGLDGLQLLQGALEFDDVAGISIGPLEGFDFVVAGIYFRIAGNNAVTLMSQGTGIAA